MTQSLRSGSRLSVISADLANPIMQGLHITSAAELMEANRLLIEQSLDAFDNKDYIPQFDDSRPIVTTCLTLGGVAKIRA